MRVSVIIVNFNGRNLLQDCLDSLEAQTRAPDEVIVVDNASSDGSIELIHESYPWVRLIASKRNLGFAAGNNLGIRGARGDVIVLLNNDTVPSPGFIESITAPLQRHENLSAVAGVLVFPHAPTTVATSGISVFTNGLALDRSIGSDWRSLASETRVFGPSGGAAAFRKSALEDVGLFAEPFFLYLEDVDLAWRMRLKQHSTMVAPEAWAHHVYSASSGEGSPLKDYYLARNRAWTLIRCWPWELWRRHWWRVAAYELAALAHAIGTRRWASVRGRIAGWLSNQRLRKSRKTIQSGTTTEVDCLLYWMDTAPSVRNILRTRDVIQTMAAGEARRTDRERPDQNDSSMFNNSY
jgi:GT2 family glycosyltransferase